jgi:hypothetical protein
MARDRPKEEPQLNRALLFLVIFGLAGSVLAQQTSQSQGYTGRGDKPQVAEEEKPDRDWESPASIQRITKMTDEDQIAKVKAAYEKMTKANEGLSPSKLGKLEYYRKQIESREKYREELKKILTKDQYRLYKAEFDKRAPYELDATEAAALETFAAEYRKTIADIDSNPDLSLEEKAELKNQHMLAFLLQFSEVAKGKKKEKMLLAVKQFQERLEKERKAKEEAAKEGGEAENKDK